MRNATEKYWNIQFVRNHAKDGIVRMVTFSNIMATLAFKYATTWFVFPINSEAELDGGEEVAGTDAEGVFGTG